MPFTSEGDKIKAIKFGLDSAFWQEWLMPAIRERAKNVLTGLATKKADDDDIKRGIYQGLFWVINLPNAELESFARLESEAAQEHNDSAEEDLRVELGRHAPFRVVPIGELKSDDAADNPAAEER